jgi:hypothetical protein
MAPETFDPDHAQHRACRRQTPPPFEDALNCSIRRSILRSFNPDWVCVSDLADSPHLRRFSWPYLRYHLTVLMRSGLLEEINGDIGRTTVLLPGGTLRFSPQVARENPHILDFLRISALSDPR